MTCTIQTVPNTKKNSFCNVLLDSRGLTLIDMAIALMVIGLLAAPLLQQYQRWQTYKDFTEASAKNSNIDNAIVNFYLQNKRYPCPADPTLPKSDVNYGAEAITGTTCAPSVLALGGTYQGSIPFKSLRLAATDGIDSWGNKILYAVTSTQADPGGPFGAGAITIKEFQPTGDFTCPDTTNIANATSVIGIHYTLLSMGETGMGAFNKEGVQLPAMSCPTGGTAPYDAENCNGDAIFMTDTCVRSSRTVAGDQYYFDDVLVGDAAASQKQSVPAATWETSTVNSKDMGTDMPLIGIGTKEPDYEVDVLGNVKADDRDTTDPSDGKYGNAHSGDFCNKDGTACFDAALIAGDDPRMECAKERRGLTGIANNAVQCNVSSDELSNNHTARTCPPGQYLTGVTAAGKLCCNYVCL